MTHYLAIVGGAVIGLFFATLAATGLGLLISHASEAVAYTLSVTAIGAVFATASFRMAIHALHSKPPENKRSLSA
jgi:hypothetical protein